MEHSTHPVREDPSPRPNKRHKYITLLTPLMDKPNEWFKIGTHSTDSGAYQAMNNLSRRKYKIPEGSWHFTNDGRDVFAKFIIKRLCRGCRLPLRIFPEDRNRMYCVNEGCEDFLLSKIR